MYYLTDQVCCCIIEQFLSYSKTFSNLSKPIYDIIPLLLVLLNLKNVESKGKNY